MNYRAVRVSLLILIVNVSFTFYLAGQKISAPAVTPPQFTVHDPFHFYRNVSSVVDWSPDELLRALPELKTLEFEEKQELLRLILQRVGENVDSMFRNFVNTTSVEEIFETRSARDGSIEGNQYEKFRYLALAHLERAKLGIDEFRTDSRGRRTNARGMEGEFFVTTGFASMSNHLHPFYQRESKFRYLGRQEIEGAKTYVVAFAQRPQGARLLGRLELPHQAAVALFQGIAWIDTSSYQIIRLRTDLLAPRPDLFLKKQATVVHFHGVHFKSIPTTLYLPREVTVTSEWRGKTYRNVHRYSQFKLFSVRVEKAQQAQPGSKPASSATSTEKADARELLVHGLALLNENKVEDAIVKFGDALRLEPDNPQAHYDLGAALHHAGDREGAINEFREALRRKPDFAEARGYLGAALFQEGDLEGAMAEFREAVRLKPEYAGARYNLGATLETLGDRQEALEQYRAASLLEPGNSRFKNKVESLSRSLNLSNSSLRQSTKQEGVVSRPQGHPPEIKVEVKQVLVPVVVTDKRGHHITGLRASDFQVFEDGVTQGLSAFTIETGGSVAEIGALAAGPTPNSSDSPQKPAANSAALPRRTYLICFDTLHSAIENFSRVRDSLRKLFEQERSSDSEYILVALGRQLQAVQNSTRNPATVLSAIRSKNFEKAIQSSEASNLSYQINQLKKLLDDYCEKCPCGRAQSSRSELQGICAGRKQQLQSFVNIAGREMTLSTLEFLRGLRSAVEQLAHVPTARTLIFVSDGFNLLPGRELFAIMAVYFPRDGEWELSPGEETQSQLEPILRLAAENNVVIYALDSRGLHLSAGGAYDASNPAPSAKIIGALPDLHREMEAVDWENGSAMAQLTSATGGVFFHNSNDLLKGMRQAFADGREYYLLAYVPSNKVMDGKFRKISVQVKGKKLVVRAKSGYWAIEN